MNEIFTTNDAREYFKKKGLSYASVNRDNWELLRRFIDEELQKHDGKEIAMKLRKRVLKREEPEFVSIGELKGIQRGFIEVDGSYFEKREAISFNSDGFIGFAGWSDSNNVQPFIRAFCRWCDEIGGSS